MYECARYLYIVSIFRTYSTVSISTHQRILCEETHLVLTTQLDKKVKKKVVLQTRCHDITSLVSAFFFPFHPLSTSRHLPVVKMLKALETPILRCCPPLLFLLTPLIFFVQLVVTLFRAVLLRSVNVLLVACCAIEARGDLLMKDYASSGDGLVLERAIHLYEAGLGLRPTGDKRRSVLLLNLGTALGRFCTEQLAGAARLTQVIMLHREALELLPPGRLGRPVRSTAWLPHSLSPLKSSAAWEMSPKQSRRCAKQWTSILTQTASAPCC
jgi:hypothetical protein